MGRVLGIIGGSLAVLVLLCCGAGYFFGGRDIINEGNASLSTPDTVAGLKKSDAPEQQSLVETLKGSESGWDDTIGAVYQDPKDPQKLVLLTGGTKLLLQPGSQLKSEFDDAEGTGGIHLNDVKEFDPGKLGGVVRCGTAKEESSTITFCGWADHGSLVIGVFFERSADESAALLRQIREEILVRN